MASTYDQKQSIAEFLSSVTSIADSFGLSYERVFSDKQVPKQPAVQERPIVEEVEVPDEKCDFMTMNLFRNNDTIYRTFNHSEEETETSFIKSPKDIFEYKARELQIYYYGSDDEG